MTLVFPESIVIGGRTDAVSDADVEDTVENNNNGDGY
jgi:hypothetical protein